MFLPDLSKRCFDLERLDTGDYTEAEYSRWHHEMKFVNHALGDIRCLKLAIRDELGRSADGRLSILDIGAGAGHLLAAVGRMDHRDLLLVGVETNPVAAAILQGRTGLTSIIADGLHLPFPDRSFDIVTSSLTLHHFDNDSAVLLLKEMYRVARLRVLIVDLHRHKVAYSLYRILSVAAFQRFTQEDGSLSIRRGFRPDELMELAKSSGMRNATVKRRAAFRLVLDVRKDD